MFMEMIEVVEVTLVEVMVLVDVVLARVEVV